MGFLSKLFGRPKNVINIESRFRIYGQTGKGSMSKVFRARDTQTNAMVALKILDPVKLARLQQRTGGKDRIPEGEVAVSLRHPNIVYTFEWGHTTDGKEFLVMEYIPGVGLNYLIETGSRRLDGKRIHYLTQIARGLSYIHDREFLHRDICPRNVMIDDEDNVKIIDFGLTVPNIEVFHRPGNRTGTPNYMAPELIRREWTDHRVDMFSFGVTMYETLCGTLPWQGRESLELMVQHLNIEPKPPSEFNAQIDRECEALILKCIERKANLRFAHMHEVVTAIERLKYRDY